MDVIIIGLLFILECLDDFAVDTLETENKLIGDQHSILISNKSLQLVS